MGVSGGEILIIMLVVLVLFGSKKMPDLARGLGKGYQEFKRATDDIKREILENTSDIVNEVNDLKSDLQGGITDFKTNVTENLNDVKSEVNKNLSSIKTEIEKPAEIAGEKNTETHESDSKKEFDPSVYPELKEEELKEEEPKEEELQSRATNVDQKSPANNLNSGNLLG
ncbi:MAG: twin-arginine translocase TatA/TatE family subunit [Bacteroidota bacterium]|nr:twin-arginine translocase TatA/TatE family subunit [Bacteroidota bacterium]